MRSLCLPSILLCCVLAGPAAAILDDDGNGNTTAPADDPGWQSVGRVGGLNGVYLGYGWMITANHVAVVPGTVVSLANANYPAMSASVVQIAHDAGSFADLKVFRIQPYPEQLPVMPIRASSPGLATPVVMIGRGRDRGTASAWGPGGWNWATTFSKRWGSNLIGGRFEPGPLVASTDVPDGAHVTRSLVAAFDPGVANEGIATLGDSGGGLFIKEGGTWELAGVQWSVYPEEGQPANTAIYDNDTLSADLAYYRDQILAVARPCQDGVDNDGDDFVDMADPECLWEGDMSELPACGDAIDNDFDGQLDLDDPDCSSRDDLLEEPDADSDLVPDADDNCVVEPNTSQLDTNSDGFGNACDADYTNDGIVGTPDYFVIYWAYGSVPGDPDWVEDVDRDGDGGIGVSEALLFYGSYNGPPGPSGLACAGTIPCP